LVLATFAGVSSASAEQGKFTLPFKAHWGQAVLEPGEYTISVPIDVSWSKVMALSGQGKTVYIVSGFETGLPYSDRSYLTIKSVNGTHYVREFNSGLTGRSFTFPAPKSVRREVRMGAIPQDNNLAVTIRH
jgi:hypothetical protein